MEGKLFETLKEIAGFPKKVVSGARVELAAGRMLSALEERSGKVVEIVNGFDTGGLDKDRVMARVVGMATGVRVTPREAQVGFDLFARWIAREIDLDAVRDEMERQEDAGCLRYDETFKSACVFQNPRRET